MTGFAKTIKKKPSNISFLSKFTEIFPIGYLVIIGYINIVCTLYRLLKNLEHLNESG